MLAILFISIPYQDLVSFLLSSKKEAIAHKYNIFILPIFSTQSTTNGVYSFNLRTKSQIIGRFFEKDRGCSLIRKDNMRGSKMLEY